MDEAIQHDAILGIDVVGMLLWMMFPVIDEWGAGQRTAEARHVAWLMFQQWDLIGLGDLVR